MAAPELTTRVSLSFPWLLRQTPKIIPRPIYRTIALEFKVGDFTVKTAEFQHELAAARRLRYKVFHREFAGKIFPIGFDKESFDQFSDTLIVRDDKTDQIVGTYRLILSSTSTNFYSSTEFDIGPILSEPGVKLELSRACIHRRYRQGRIINLLWRGIARYIQQSGASLVFGMSSVQTMSPVEICKLMKIIERSGHFSDRLRVRARESYRTRFDVTGPVDADADAAPDCFDKSLLPGLIRFYLKAGAKICSEPALDEHFRCVDFLTLWDIEGGMSSVHRRYFET